MKAWQVIVLLVVLAGAGAGVWWYTKRSKAQAQLPAQSPYYTPPRAEGSMQVRPVATPAAPRPAPAQKLGDLLSGSAKTAVTKVAQQALGNVEATAKKFVESKAQELGSMAASKIGDLLGGFFSK